jgi:Dynein heavy chain, N-terminal region 1
METSPPTVTTNGINHNTTHTEPTVAFDSEIFHVYLLTLLPSVIGALPLELDSLFDHEFDKRVAHFAADNGGSLYVVKTKEESEGAYSSVHVITGIILISLDTDDAPPTFTYHLTPHLTYHPSHVTTLALIKRGQTLDPLMPFASQLHFSNLFGNEETPYESLHTVISCRVKPWFDAFVGAHISRKDRHTQMGIHVTKKKFAELELLLLHLQQNVEIPETCLVIHPVIQHAVEQAIMAGMQPNTSYIPLKLLNDSSFLNLLHGHVNVWIKAIQSMTKLTKDVVSGTASQEINFWLSLECALDGIEMQLRSDKVNRVINCLWNAKWFQVTVSFIVDTGLKDATDLGV